MLNAIYRIVLAVAFVLVFAASPSFAQSGRSFGGSSGYSGYRGGGGQAGRMPPGGRVGTGGGAGHANGMYAGRTSSMGGSHSGGSASGAGHNYGSGAGHASSYSSHAGGAYRSSNSYARAAQTAGSSESPNRYAGNQRQAHQSMRPETEPHIGGGGARMGSSHSSSGKDTLAHPAHAKASRDSSANKKQTKPTAGVRQSPSAAGKNYNKPINLAGRTVPHMPGAGPSSSARP
jgi:hypothetical protein